MRSTTRDRLKVCRRVSLDLAVRLDGCIGVKPDDLQMARIVFHDPPSAHTAVAPQFRVLGDLR